MQASRILGALLLAVACTGRVWAANTPAASASTATPVPEEASAVTQHALTINGQRIAYTATAGTLLVRNGDHQPIGSFFYVAYTENGVKNLDRRPVTFIFNGGPGSSSIWLHMGSFGPVRVVTSDAKPTPPPPYDLAQNQYSLLDRSDLVFIDAIGTGFSRIVGHGTPKDFYG
ncbi:MAG: S10 family serine carboxypeptidase-like protein, partial [Gammaproteobacteria bacterium]